MHKRQREKEEIKMSVNSREKVREAIMKICSAETRRECLT